MKKWLFFAIFLPWMARYGSETSFLLIFGARDDLVKVSWKSDARKCQNQLTPPYFDQLSERHQLLFVSYIYFGKFENIPRSFQNIDNISYLLKFRKLRNMFSQLGRKNDVGRGILKNVDNYCHFQWMVARVRQRPGRENCGHIIDWCFSSTACPQGFNAP